MSKRREIENSQNNNSESSDSDFMEYDEEVPQSEVQVDFEACTPTDSDFSGIVKLLNQLFLKASVDTSEMAELIIQNGAVSSVIKQCEVPDDSDDDEEDDTFGVLSIIDLSKKEINSVKQIWKLLNGKCKANSDKETFQSLQLLSADSKKKVGLLLSERFVNIPPQISVPLYETLSDELKESNLKNARYKFTDYILISKLHEVATSSKNDSQFIYSNAEDELLLDFGKALYKYDVESESASTAWDVKSSELKPFRQVIHLSADHLDSFITKLKSSLA